MTELKKTIVGGGLKINHVGKVAGIERNRFGRLVRGLDLPDVEEAAKIVAALRECTGKDVTVEMLWPTTAPAEKVQQ